MCYLTRGQHWVTQQVPAKLKSSLHMEVGGYTMNKTHCEEQFASFQESRSEEEGQVCN